MHVDQETAEAEGRVIRLHYGGGSAMPAASLVGVLEGLIGMVGEASSAGLLGDGPAPEVLVQPPEEGSFEIVAILQWVTDNPELAIWLGGGAIGMGGNVIMVIRWLIRIVRGEVDDFDYVDDGTSVKVKWKDGTVEEIPREAWKRFQKLRRKTKRNLQKVLAPTRDRDRELTMTSDPDGPGPQPQVELVAGKDDYRAALAAEEPTDVQVNRFDVEGKLRMVDFDPDKPWRIRTIEGSRRAQVEDLEFLQKVREGLPLTENDIFQFRIREEITTSNGRHRTKWAIESVLNHRRAASDETDRAQGTDTA